jgi:hypothetical protein
LVIILPTGSRYLNKKKRKRGEKKGREKKRKRGKKKEKKRFLTFYK